MKISKFCFINTIAAIYIGGVILGFSIGHLKGNEIIHFLTPKNIKQTEIITNNDK
jgi:hypothetical protein